MRVLQGETRETFALRFAGGEILDSTASSSKGLSFTEIGRTKHVVSACTPEELIRLGVPHSILDQHEVCHGDRARSELGDLAGDAVRLVWMIDEAARSFHDRVTNVLVDADVTIQHASFTLDGEQPVSDTRRMIYLTVRVLAEHAGRRATGFYTPGLSGEFGVLDGGQVGTEAARRACVSLAAQEAPTGWLPVVVGPGRGAVLVHEACCHPLEGDEILRGSIYAGAIGTPIAAPAVTIVDDPTMAGAVGSYRIDDEGVAARPTTLVCDGLMQNLLLDRSTARELGTSSTGNGRRASWRHSPLPRMSNTVVRPGRERAEDIIGSVGDGIYAQHVGGGQVTERTGDFVFRIHNGYRIRAGQLAEPIKETTVSGVGQRVLREIDALADDAELGAAKCGKHGQLIPVGVSGPTMLIRSLMVGGS